MQSTKNHLSSQSNLQFFFSLQAPEICESFALNASPNEVRRAIRAEFERNRFVSDPKVIDVLLLKGRQSYQEIMNSWAQDSHVLGITLAPKERPQRTFMQKFLEGKSYVLCSFDSVTYLLFS